jgi:hypothetical protein
LWPRRPWDSNQPARARPADVVSRDRQELQLDLAKVKPSQGGRY